MYHARLNYSSADFEIDATVALNRGEIHALVGASGSGKTTLLRLLAGLQTPTSGEIRSGDRLLFSSEKGINLSPQSRQTGLVFQDYALFSHMNVFENVAYGVAKTKRSRIVEDWLRRMALSHKRDVYPEALSGGEKQRVALARSLAASPDILLMDEPFAALNAELRLALRRDLRMLVRESGVPVLMAIHDLQEAQVLAEKVSVIVNGKILQSGKTEEVFQAPSSIDTARALGWTNIMQWSEIKNIVPQVDACEYLILPPQCFSLSENNEGLKLTIVDRMTTAHSDVYDGLMPTGQLLHLECGKSHRILEIGKSYHFSIHPDQILTIK